MSNLAEKLETQEEPQRRKGYYLIGGKNCPSVSMCTGSIGSSEGLVYWGADCGAKGLVWELGKIKDVEALKEKLGSPSCIEWAVEQGRRGLSSERARVTGFGHVQHGALEYLAKEIEIDTSEWPDNAKTAFNTLKSFWEDVGLTADCSERVVFSSSHGYGGRLDLVVTITEEQIVKLRPYLMKKSDDPIPGPTITDFKTGKFYPYPHAMQLGAYAHAYNETCGVAASGGLIINIQRDKPEDVQCSYFSKERLNDGFKRGFLVGKAAWEYLESPSWYRRQEGIL